MRRPGRSRRARTARGGRRRGHQRPRRRPRALGLGVRGLVLRRLGVRVLGRLGPGVVLGLGVRMRRRLLSP
ncbi:hypothetical protein GCM10009801_77780 [Streptomyces albiaxialis]|uniref:Uncharacterized protein n=1 Tax=Streptomyces albiaxialis TaxID=329523 RepID=A0ABP5IQH3_9ACTN